jgi:hypothetical protein
MSQRERFCGLILVLAFVLSPGFVPASGLSENHPGYLSAELLAGIDLSLLTIDQEAFLVRVLYERTLLHRVNVLFQKAGKPPKECAKAIRECAFIIPTLPQSESAFIIPTLPESELKRDFPGGELEVRRGIGTFPELRRQHSRFILWVPEIFEPHSRTLTDITSARLDKLTENLLISLLGLRRINVTRRSGG